MTRVPLTIFGRARARVQILWARLGGCRISHGRAPLFWRGRIGIGGRGSIAFGDRFKAYGAPIPCRLTVCPGGSIEIGDWAVVNHGVEIYAARSVKIGDDCQFADLVAIYDTDFHEVEEGAPIRVAPVEIGDNVWCGRGAIVLAGVTIGDHAVIAAGAVVTEDVPARSLAAGNPARVIRELRADDGWARS